MRDVLAPTRLVVPLEARTLQEAEALLLERLAAAHGVLDVVKLQRRVAERRAEDAVAMGDRAFLLHYRTDAVGQLVVALSSRLPGSADRRRTSRSSARASSS